MPSCAGPLLHSKRLMPGSSNAVFLPTLHAALPPMPTTTTATVQGVAAAWAALSELSRGCSPHELQLDAEAPELLPRLAAAAKAVADGLTFLGLMQVGEFPC